MIKGIHHAAIRCHGNEKFREAVRFYTEVLGLKIISSWGGAERMACMAGTDEGVIVELFDNGTSDIGHDRLQHIALATDDVDGCIDAVRRAGYEVITEPADVSIPSEPPLPIRMGFCYGPCGEEIEFFRER